MKKTQELLSSAIDISERMNLTVVEFERVVEKIADKTLDSAIAIEAFAAQIDGVVNVVSDMPMRVNTLRDSIIDAEVRIATAPEIQIPDSLGGMDIPQVGAENPAEIPKRSFDEIQDAAIKITDTFDRLSMDLKDSKLGISGFDTTAAGFEGATLQDMPERLRDFDDVMRLSLDELMYNIEDETMRLRDNFKAGSISSEEYDAAMSTIRDSDGLVDSMLSNLGAYSDLAAGIEHIAEELGDYVEAFQKASERAANSISDTVWAGLKDIPGGQFVGELLGVDKLADNLKRAGEQGIVGIMSAIRDDGVSGLMALTKGAMTFGKSLYAALGPIGMITAALGALVAITVNYRKKVNELSKSWGISRDAAASLHEDMLDVVSSTEGVLGGMEQVEGVMKGMVEQSGNFKINPIPTESLRAISSFGSKFGIAAEDMGKLNVLLQQSSPDFINPENAGKFAANIQTTAVAMADAAGIAPSLVTKDMIENAELLSSAYYGVPEAFSEATVEIRKMGSSLSKAKQIGEGLLDIETSITSEFEANAVLASMGVDKQVNLANARNLALAGDYKGMMDEITENMVSQADYMAMDMHQRKVVAKSVGMTTDDMATMFHYQELSKNLTVEEQALYAKHKATLGDINKLSSEELATELAKRESIDQMGATWESIKATLAKALLPLIETFSGILEGVVPVLQLAGHLLKGMISVLNVLLWPVKEIAKFFVGISTTIREIAEGLGVGGDMASNIGSLSALAAAVGASFLIGFKPVMKMVGWLSGQFTNIGNLVRGILGKEQKEQKLLKVSEKMSGRKRRRREGFNAGRSKSMKRSLKAEIIDDVVASTSGCGCDSGIGGMTDSYGGSSKGKKQGKGIKAKSRPSAGAKGRFLRMKGKKVGRAGMVRGRFLRMKGKKLGRGMLGKLGGIASLGVGALSMFGGGGSIAPSETGGVADSIGNAASNVDAASDVASVGKSVSGRVAKKSATKGVGKVGSKVGAKVGAKIAGKGMMKALVKKIPGVGAIAGGAFAIQRLMKGDFMGAGLEMLSGVSSIIPGVGTALSVGLDAALAAKDIAKANNDSKTASEEINDSASEISDKVTAATEAYVSPLKGMDTPEQMESALASMKLDGDVVNMTQSEIMDSLVNARDSDIIDGSVGIPNASTIDSGVELPSDGAMQREYQNNMIVQDNTKTHVVTHSDPAMKRKYDEMISAIRESSNKKSQVNIGDDEVRRMNGIIRKQNGI